MLKILHIVGARPNFMKIAPLMQAFAHYPDHFNQHLIHTGQHYDNKMSKVFFEELTIPQPDKNLNVGSGSQTFQTTQIMLKFEEIIPEYNPDWVVVVGDVNSTLACSLVCAKMGIKVAHIEAGLRSFDRTMPEEINRVLTDQIADLLFTPSEDADNNLAKEGIDTKKIHLVGNIMIDSLIKLLPRAEQGWPELKNKYNLNKYVLATLHRPANVDNPENLKQILLAFKELIKTIKIVFPIHPRTKNNIAKWGINIPVSSNLILLDPIGYLEFVALENYASLVLTDSGGIQEETTYLGVPCLTVRENTERPITITMGTNKLVKCKKEFIAAAAEKILNSSKIARCIPPLWDGRTSERIVEVFRDMY